MALSVVQLERRGARLIREGGDGAWRLWEFPDKTSGGWRSFYLWRKKPRKSKQRTRFWLGHDGERFARNGDTAALQFLDAGLHDDLLEGLNTK